MKDIPTFIYRKLDENNKDDREKIGIIIRQLYYLSQRYPEKFNPSRKQWEELIKNVFRMSKVLSYYSHEPYERYKKLEKILTLLISEVVHASNPSFSHVQDKPNLIIKVLDTYIRMSKMMDSFNIRYDPSRVYRFLEWFVTIGNLAEGKKDSEMIEILGSRRRFSEAELLITYMHIGKQRHEIMIARSMSNYIALVKDIKYEKLFMYSSLDPIGAVLIGLIAHERGMHIKDIDSWILEKVLSYDFRRDIVENFDVHLDKLKEFLDKIERIRSASRNIY